MRKTCTRCGKSSPEKGSVHCKPCNTKLDRYKVWVTKHLLYFKRKAAKKRTVG